MKDTVLGSISEKHYGFIFHYYRAEIYRETNWRNRMDVTTNWAIVVTAAIVSFVFSNEGVSHGAILLNFIVVGFFLYVESRRYRYYSSLKKRTRLIEKNVLAPLFSGRQVSRDAPQWSDTLADSLEKPQVSMSRLESFAWRLRRNYLVIFTLLIVAWLARVNSFPQKAVTVSDFFDNAKVWFIPGDLVALVFISIYLWFVIIAINLPRVSLEDDLP